MCSINNFKDEIKYAQAQLTVNVPVTFLKRPQNVLTTEGNSVEFYCSVDGKPTPSIQWKKDGLLIKNSNESKQFHYEFYQNNQVIKINNLHRINDSGIYECIAKNAVNSISSTARLTINKASNYSLIIIIS